MTHSSFHVMVYVQFKPMLQLFLDLSQHFIQLTKERFILEGLNQSKPVFVVGLSGVVSVL